MRSVPLYEAKNRLSALIEEVERTGEEIVITKHGRPAVKIARARARPSSGKVRDVWRQLNTSLDEQAAARAEAEARGDAPANVTWEQLKAELEEDR